MNLYECELCGILWTNTDGVESDGICSACNTVCKPRPDLKLVPVGEQMKFEKTTVIVVSTM